jgi:hypothetical protein
MFDDATSLTGEKIVTRPSLSYRLLFRKSFRSYPDDFNKFSCFFATILPSFGPKASL